MCRWLAYSGSPILLDTLLFKPEHSLIDQSRQSLRMSHLYPRSSLARALAANEDGVGVGWYGLHEWPALYRDIRPAWNDENLQEIAEQTRSGMFLAHVRSSAASPVQRTNCHPFRDQRWLFQHNGSLARFPRLKRAMDLEISPELYPHMKGSTDSERMFFLALTLGLNDDPPRALALMAGRIESLAHAAGIERPLVMTIALCDGKRLFAVRYSSNATSPSLFHSQGLHALREIGGEYEEMPDGAVVILSEPLDQLSEHWEEVPEGTLLVVQDGVISSQPFQPAV